MSDDTVGGDTSRRDFLRKAGVVAGTAAWMAPTLQVIRMAGAGAQTVEGSNTGTGPTAPPCSGATVKGVVDLEAIPGADVLVVELLQEPSGDDLAGSFFAAPLETGAFEFAVGPSGSTWSLPTTGYLVVTVGVGDDSLRWRTDTFEVACNAIVDLGLIGPSN